MIHVVRKPCPDILAKKAAAWTAALLQARTNEAANPCAETKTARENAEKKYNQKAIKEALKDMFFGKCAYCESHIVHIDYGDIEHFRPKTLYPECCFDWDNLLLGCTVCNNNKLAQFPTAPEKQLINPTNELPENYFDFEYDGYTQLANVLPKNSRGEETEKILRLNRSDLLKNRSNEIKKIVAIAIFAQRGNTDALFLLRESCESKSQYAAFSRAIAREYGLF